MSNIETKFKKMTIRELKNELPKYKNNPKIGLLIRSIIKDKAIRYKMMKNKPNNFINNTCKNIDLIDQIIDDINNADENNILYLKDEDFYTKKNDKFKNEITRDSLNNNLMDRMNSELDIRNFRKKYKKVDFIPPFTDKIGDNYAPFNCN